MVQNLPYRRCSDDEADVAGGHLVLRPRKHLRVEVLAEPDDGGAEEATAGVAPGQLAFRDFGTWDVRVWFTFPLKVMVWQGRSTLKFAFTLPKELSLHSVTRSL